eukprot:7460802-Alexandrium_andersonii.AAC.1
MARPMTTAVLSVTTQQGTESVAAETPATLAQFQQEGASPALAMHVEAFEPPDVVVASAQPAQEGPPPPPPSPSSVLASSMSNDAWWIGGVLRV